MHKVYSPSIEQHICPQLTITRAAHALPELKTPIAHLAERINLECRAPDNMHEMSLQGPYASTVSNTESPPLSGSIPYNTVTACDGDGIVKNIDVTDENPLRNAV